MSRLMITASIVQNKIEFESFQVQFKLIGNAGCGGIKLSEIKLNEYQLVSVMGFNNSYIFRRMTVIAIIPN